MLSVSLSEVTDWLRRLNEPKWSKTRFQLVRTLPTSFPVLIGFLLSEKSTKGYQVASQIKNLIKNELTVMSTFRNTVAVILDFFIYGSVSCSSLLRIVLG